jgi:FAD binding domain
VYTFSASYAERWRRGAILLAGDAAHLMPPFAGQGLCAGIRDAANLAWKLDLVLSGQAGDTLLDTYQQERLPSTRQAIEFSVELGKIICLPDLAEAARRDETMAAAVSAEPDAAPPMPGIAGGVVHPAAPHAGTLFVQGTVNGRLFDDTEGAGWRLVTDGLDAGAIGSAAADPGALVWFESIGGRVVALSSPDPAYAHWFAGHHAVAALQRPDFHLYGTASTAAGAAALIADLRRHLTGAHVASTVSSGAAL